MGHRKQRRFRRASRRPPASGRKPTAKLPAHTVADSAEALLAFHARFAACFERREQRYWSLFYLCGQLSNLPRKTIEAMVLNLHGADGNAGRDLERFLSQGRWDQDRLIQQQQVIAAEGLGEPDGVVIADGSGFPKQGDHSVGVAYQYCGHLGKVANCQQGVFLVYASPRGHAFLDAQLYLPQDWFTQAYQARWQACRIPAEVAFRTEPQIALDMIAALAQRAVVPFRWVTADETYGKNPAFLEGIEQLGKWGLVEVPTDTRVWLHTPAIEPPGQGLLGRPRTRPRVARNAPAPQEVKVLAAQMPQAAWTRRVIKQGSKGPLVAEFAFLRATTVRDDLPGPRRWVIFRRSLSASRELKVYFSNAPTTCPRSEFIRVSGMRWPVETALEDGKGEIGMDHYETRTWLAWHRHMAHSALAHLFLVGLCLQWQKKSSLDRAPGPPGDRAGHRRGGPPLTRRACHRALPATPQSRGLSFASQAHLEATQPTL